MNNKFRVLSITCFLVISSQLYGVTNSSINTNSTESVDSIIKSLQKEVYNLQVETKNISKEDKKQQPQFVMYNNVVVHHNANENQDI